MTFQLKKLFFVLIFNTCLFSLLVIGIQNSVNKNKVNLLIKETVHLPDSFIIGISFISGSILGNLTSLNVVKSNES